MKKDNLYDVVMIGGGLAGVALSIQLRRAGYEVAVFEKETYPLHRVCGEYVSNESVDFITDLGLDFETLDLPKIHRLLVTAPNGKSINAALQMGGIGISRYLFDYKLSVIAREIGVEVFENTKVEDVIFKDGTFTVSTQTVIAGCKVAAGSFGKRSNLDVKWSRAFITHKQRKLNNWVGVKYHIKCDHDKDMIALHNFKNGYCGISKVEGDKYCLCYMTTAANLKSSNNSIEQMEKSILCSNPHLQKIFSSAQFLFDKPEIISQISFEKKSPVEDHIVMIGDAAGMITPLCGNGMSMALHSSKIAFECIDRFLKGKIDRNEMEHEYSRNWKTAFNTRLKTGRFIQYFFGKVWLTNLFISCVKPFPSLIQKLIRSTHGSKF